MDASAFVCDRTISVARRKILSMFKNFWRINVRHSYSQRFASIRLSIASLRQHTLEITAVNKFAYRGQLICISSEWWRSRDASLRCFANYSEQMRIEAIWIRRVKTNYYVRKTDGIRLHTNQYVLSLQKANRLSPVLAQLCITKFLLRQRSEPYQN